MIVAVIVTMILIVSENDSDSVCGSDSGRVHENCSTLIFQGGRMGQGNGFVSSFWLEPENHGVRASFRLELEN
jgi:hypothetical protein